MRAHLSRRGLVAATTIVCFGLMLWALRHIVAVLSIGSPAQQTDFYWVFLFSFIIFATTVILAQREKPFKTESEEDQYVTVIVPAYNEDEEVLEDCLMSLLRQTRLPDEIFLTDDGSNKADYSQLKDRFIYEASQLGVVAHWHRQNNKGKRQAQAAAVKVTPKATVYVTVDSDSMLDDEALSEIVKPFSDETIQSVAGVVLARNNKVNLLARFTDLLFVTGQLMDRSLMSGFGSVLVNSGGLAAYRADILRDNLDAYLNESFMGSHVEFSDDSMLTLYALKRGKTVQQPSAFVFTMMPETLHHHFRQQIRWMRGSFIRSWWRLRYLPILSPGFIRQTLAWIQLAMVGTLVVVLFIIKPVALQAFSPWLLLFPIIVGYIQALRYFTISRSDETIWSQLLSFALAPVASMWSFFIMRPVRLYAMATCLKTGWGTRGDIEVKASKTQKLTVTLADVQRAHARVLADYISTYDSLHDVSAAWNKYFQSLPAAAQRDYWDALYTFSNPIMPSDTQGLETTVKTNGFLGDDLVLTRA